MKLLRSASDVYPAVPEDLAWCKVQLTESLKCGVPTRFEVTDVHTQDRSALNPGSWMEDALVLLALGVYDCWLFYRIDEIEGRFVIQLKEDANPMLGEELRIWRGNAISLEGKRLQDVLPDLQKATLRWLPEYADHEFPAGGAVERRRGTLPPLPDQPPGRGFDVDEEGTSTHDPASTMAW